MNRQYGEPVDRRRFLGTVLAGATAAGAVPLLAGCGTAVPGAVAAPTGPPRRGGTLRVGVTGGGAKDSLDAHTPVANPDIARVCNLYEPLVYRDPQFRLQMVLAESLTPAKDAMVWTARLRKGIRFHDGRTVTADDVIATVKRITDPKNPKVGASALGSLDHMVKRDSRTVEFHMKTPCAIFDDYLAQYYNGIVPADYDPHHPIGTGPFKASAFTAGEQSTFVRNEYYWQDHQPYLDKLVIIDFSDDNARVNALLSTQVDAIDQVPLPLVRVIDTDPRLRVLTSKSGTWLPFTMRVDHEPFDDVRVRQAMRLVVDRPQMIRQVLSGQGQLGNDMYARYDPAYPTDWPQRKQDIAQARSLLKEAGKPNLKVELVTSPVQAGIVEAAQVLAKQAGEAGVTVKLRKVDTGTFYGDNYLKWPFAQDFWITRNYLAQAAQGSLPKSPFNETHWGGPKYADLVGQAIRTVDESKRDDLIRQAEKMEYDSGGYLIWAFPNMVDAHTRYVVGLRTSHYGLSMCGYRFRDVWMS